MNEQAQTWAGTFGDEYAKRSPGSVASNLAFFHKALDECEVLRLNSVIEFGAGVGNNLRALRQFFHNDLNVPLRGIEINATAFAKLSRDFRWSRFGTMFDWDCDDQADLTLSKGLLIHIPPESLQRAYEVLYKASRHYILVAEYFAPKLTAIRYRGRDDLLWKGPYAYDMLDKYQGLKVLDYGFVSSRDRNPQDDLNWWLLEKPRVDHDPTAGIR